MESTNMFWLWFVSVSFFTRLVIFVLPKNVWVESWKNMFCDDRGDLLLLLTWPTWWSLRWFIVIPNSNGMNVMYINLPSKSLTTKDSLCVYCVLCQWYKCAYRYIHTLGLHRCIYIHIPVIFSFINISLFHQVSFMVEFPVITIGTLGQNMLMGNIQFLFVDSPALKINPWPFTSRILAGGPNSGPTKKTPPQFNFSLESEGPLLKKCNVLPAKNN